MAWFTFFCLSGHQSNDSDCIYICVMTGQTGKTIPPQNIALLILSDGLHLDRSLSWYLQLLLFAGRNLSDFWEVLEKSPVINYTFSSNTSSDLGK